MVIRHPRSKIIRPAYSMFAPHGHVALFIEVKSLKMLAQFLDKPECRHESALVCSTDRIVSGHRLQGIRDLGFR